MGRQFFVWPRGRGADDAAGIVLEWALVAALVIVAAVAIIGTVGR